MKSNICKLNKDLTCLEAVLAEVEKVTTYNALEDKKALRIRLLAEELCGMLPGLVENFSGEFWAENDGDDGTADGGVDGGGDEARLLAHLLADLHIVAHGHACGGRCAQVHGQGEDCGLGLGEADQSLVLGRLLALHRVDAAVPAVETLFADGLDVFVDDLEVDLGVVAELDGLRGQFGQAECRCRQIGHHPLK